MSGVSGILEQFPGLRAALVELFREVGPLLVRELQQQTQGDEWVDQFRSPLRMPNQKSSRRHCTIVRRRIAANLPGALISPDGKQFFLTTAALSEEMRGQPRPPVKAEPTDTEESDGYTQILRIARGGR